MQQYARGTGRLNAEQANSDQNEYWERMKKFFEAKAI
jgi:hypothetical protein